MYQLSIQMYTLRNFMKTREELEKTLEKVAEIGYEYVQITPPPYIGIEEFAALLRKNNLKADSAICSVYNIPEKLDEIEFNAKALGTDVVRTDSIRSEDRYTVEGFKSFAEHLNLCGNLLRKRGLKFMYHFHSFEFIKLGNTRGIDILLENTNPDFVMFQPDVFWLAAAGSEPSRSLEMFRGRAEYMHLKDYVIVPNSNTCLEITKSASAPVGTGNLNWKEIIKTAKSIGIKNFVVEDDMGILDPFESAQQSIYYLEKLGLIKEQ